MLRVFGVFLVLRVFGARGICICTKTSFITIDEATSLFFSCFCFFLILAQSQTGAINRYLI